MRFSHWKTLLACAGLVACAAAPGYHFSRPKIRRGIPQRDYQYRSFSLPARAVSGPAIVLLAARLSDAPGAELPFPSPPGAPPPPPPVAVVPATRSRVKAFQFNQSALQVDHCRISQMAVHIDESGHWSVSLQADQNPVAPVSPAEVIPNLATKEEMREHTAHLRRNQFFVKIRCFGQYGPAGTGDELGKPVVFLIEPEPFWVQKGVPRQVLATGWHGDLARSFDLIDRVEIEFYCRTNEF